MTSSPPRLNQADIEAITAAFSTVLNTAYTNLANQIGANFANRIGTLKERRRRDIYPDHRHNHRQRDQVKVPVNLSYPHVMDSSLLQVRQPYIPEKVPEEVEVSPKKFDEEVIPIVTEQSQEILTPTEVSEPDLTPTIGEGDKDENFIEPPKFLEVKIDEL